MDPLTEKQLEFVQVRDAAKVTMHLMFGLIATAATHSCASRRERKNVSAKGFPWSKETFRNVLPPLSKVLIHFAD